MYFCLCSDGILLQERILRTTTTGPINGLNVIRTKTNTSLRTALAIAVVSLPILASSQTQQQVRDGLAALASSVTTYKAIVIDTSKGLSATSSITYSWEWANSKHVMHETSNPGRPEVYELYNGTALVTLARPQGTTKWTGDFIYTDHPNQLILGMAEGALAHRGKSLSSAIGNADLTIEQMPSGEFGTAVRVSGSTADEKFTLVLAPEKSWLCVSYVWEPISNATSREVGWVSQATQVNGKWVPQAILQRAMLKQGSSWKVTHEAVREASGITVGDALSSASNLATFAGTQVMERSTNDAFTISDTGTFVRDEIGRAIPSFNMRGTPVECFEGQFLRYMSHHGHDHAPLRIDLSPGKTGHQGSHESKGADAPDSGEAR